MVVETKYAGAWQNNAGNWTNPNNLLNISDALCGYKAVAYGSGSYHYLIDLISFGWNIPPNSTINSVKFGFKSRVGNAFNTLDALFCFFKSPHFDWTIESGKILLAPACSDVTVRESDDILPTLQFWGEDVLANLNNGIYYLQLDFLKSKANDGIVSRAQCDCLWMTVDYTPPTVVKKPFMDGLVLVE